MTSLPRAILESLPSHAHDLIVHQVGCINCGRVVNIIAPEHYRVYTGTLLAQGPVYSSISDFDTKTST